MSHPLDNPTRSSLLGPHADFAIRHGEVLRYPPGVAPFAAMPDEPDDASWRDLATLLPDGSVAVIAGLDIPAPKGWEVVMTIPGFQLVDDSLNAAPDDEAVVLGAADVPEMLDLVGRTKPGPFGPRTYELGTYLGIRRDGVLAAMAGERMQPPGFTEVSAVCTDPAFRGQGLASRLLLAVAAGIRDRGDTPFLHVAGANEGALRLYESLGFRTNRSITFVALRSPGAGASGMAPLPPH
jgi:ribosomal protein S18 acetylase RimI-like enzyme